MVESKEDAQSKERDESAAVSTDDSLAILRKENHERIHALWELIQVGGIESLPAEEQRLGKIMMEHEEFYNQFEIADLLYDYKYDPDSEVDPFLHIAFHQVIEVQLETREPIEVLQFYNAMRKHRISKHEIIHQILVIFIHFFSMS